MEIYGAGCAIETKSDGSPVTIADHEAERIILDWLAQSFPDIPVVAEEEASAGHVPELGSRFFLVDPLDGTRGFADRTGEFTVNIALIKAGAPVAGVVYAPESKLLYHGIVGQGAARRADGVDMPIRARSRSAGQLAAIGSRNHRLAEDDSRLEALGVTSFTPSGSSLKFCTLAEGAADVYPRWGRTMEWDTAAGQAILEAAGGRVMAMDDAGKETGPLRYGNVGRGFANPHFIAWGR
jgi:3'(2'),5'-bisphosphate nucleotidase